jgi:hypothetical protein
MNRMLPLALAVVLAAPALPAPVAWAQAAATIATPEPVPPVDENAPPQAFLQAARQSLAAGRTGEAMEAMERAETRALDRSVRPSRANIPDTQPFITLVAAARAALDAHDRATALAKIDEALALTPAPATQP